ncbi:hypothetical protein AeRB84_012939 [Aphanomyces euteiches]|nr:hypothetical protein AeRB84_012939 [Aphanomyces euteiches]
MEFEAATWRYDLQVFGDGNVDVRVSHPRNECRDVCLLFWFLYVFGFNICMITFFGKFISIWLTLAWVLFDLLIVVCMCGVFADLLYGYEHFAITDKSFSYTRSRGCTKQTRHYDINLMGPLKATGRVCQDNYKRRAARMQFGFDYGGRMISMGDCFLSDEIDPFLNRLTPYLPDKIKPLTQVNAQLLMWCPLSNSQVHAI